MSDIASKLLGASNMIQTAKTMLNTGMEVENRFNDVDGSEDRVHGFDVAAEEGDDVLYGYAGTDENGNTVVGAGLLDVERSEGGLLGVEVLTAEAKFEHLPNGDVRYAEGEANGIELEFSPVWGQQLGVTVGDATGNVGVGDDRAGLYGTASIVEAEYSNGAPSADNDNDISVTGGAGVGIGFGFNVLYGDPDGDGIRNLGFEGAFGPFGGGISSEWLGKNIVELDDKAIGVYNDVTDMAGGAVNEVQDAAGGLKSLTGKIPGTPWG